MKLSVVETEIARLARRVRKYIRSGDAIIAGDIARMLAHKVTSQLEQERPAYGNPHWIVRK